MSIKDHGSQVELGGTQDTTISYWTILVRPGTPLREDSTVVDASGRTFEVQGKPARRPERATKYVAALARLISDMQS
ncbi:hypothetical protein [Amycolatopsis sp. NPDC059657]|uniref:hypothetical protein n=1 Tax=Amycolatopsis sp. NPDC059657 TaxID=3346899 RepID=UPI00366F7F0C